MAIPLESGFFLVPRRWMDHAHFKPGAFTDHLAYIWSLEQAAFVPHNQRFNGAPYWVERGEFVTSYAKMQDHFGWTLKRARGLVSRMTKAGLWQTRRAYNCRTAATIISICNYEEMQAINSYYAANQDKAAAKRRQREGKHHKERVTNGERNWDQHVDTDPVGNLHFEGLNPFIEWLPNPIDDEEDSVRSFAQTEVYWPK